MEITRLESGDIAALDEAMELWERIRVHDRPDLPPMLRTIVEVELAEGGTANSRKEYHRVHRDGRLIATLAIELPTEDGAHTAACFAAVHPDHRRCGIGTVLLDLATRRTREAGRTTQQVHTAASVDGGAGVTGDRSAIGFLTAAGFDPVHTDIVRRLDLAAVDRDDEQRLLDDSWAHADGYRPVHWIDGTPPEHVEAVASLWGRIGSDVPWGDMDVSGWRFDAQRVRDEDIQRVRWGFTTYNAYLQHVNSGQLVAHSVAVVHHENPPLAQQWITLVHPEHRGHRLGMIAKIEGHRLLRAQDRRVRWIDTTNAADNTHMAAINDRLGFTIQGGGMTFQRRI